MEMTNNKPINFALSAADGFTLRFAPVAVAPLLTEVFGLNTI